MSKLWGVPITSPQIEELSYYQLLLYQALIVRDRERQQKEAMSTVEYAMAFMKPDVLKKVTEDRKSREETGALSSEDAFAKQVESKFGRKIVPKGTRKKTEKQLDHDTIKVVSKD